MKKPTLKPEIEKLLANGVRNHVSDERFDGLFLYLKEFIADVEQLARQEAVEEVVNEILEAEYVVNPKTCPNGDVSQVILHPELWNQVVGTIHMSFARYMKLKALLLKKEE